MNYSNFLTVFNLPDNLYYRYLYLESSTITKNFTSEIYLNNNSLFHLEPTEVRTKFYSNITINQDVKRASYSTLQDSLKDRIDIDYHLDHDTKIIDQDTIYNYLRDIQENNVTELDAKFFTSSFESLLNYVNSTSNTIDQPGTTDTIFSLPQKKSLLNRSKIYIIIILALISTIFFVYKKYFKKQ